MVRTVLRLALDKRTTSDRWTSSATNGYHVLSLSPNPDLEIRNKSIDYQVDGMFAALYMTYLAVGPDPISPFILLAASINSVDDFNFDMDFARATLPDLDTLNRVEEILLLRADNPVDTADSSNASLIALANELGVRVS